MTPWQTNVSTFDPWTVAHFIWGVLARLVGLPLWLTTLLATVFEALETPAERLFPSIFPYRTSDTVRNAVGDIAGVAAGWLVTDAVLRLDLSKETWENALGITPNPPPNPTSR